MTSKEIKKAMEDGTPVEYKGVHYKGIVAYIYRRVEDIHSGKVTFILQCELLDRCGHSVVVADADKVNYIK